MVRRLRVDADLNFRLDRAGDLQVRPPLGRDSKASPRKKWMRYRLVSANPSSARSRYLAERSL
jgi:hypothetical protein